jgi:putative transposase
MVFYRRNYVPGGSYFFTVTLRERGTSLLVDYIELLRAAYAEVARKRPFHTDALVVMPDHIHAIWTLPPGDSDYSGRWRAIKSGFVRLLARQGVALARNTKGEAQVWQRRFWEHTLRDDTDFTRHCDYIHFNPVKHGFVSRAADWPHSSLHKFVERGICEADWGGGTAGDGGGE